MQHEFMHALGVHHEQVRGDRDDHITVYQKNVNTTMWHNYNKLGGPNAYGWVDIKDPYELESVMHYDSRSFMNTTVKGNCAYNMLCCYNFATICCCF